MGSAKVCNTSSQRSGLRTCKKSKTGGWANVVRNYLEGVEMDNKYINEGGLRLFVKNQMKELIYKRRSKLNEGKC